MVAMPSILPLRAKGPPGRGNRLTIVTESRREQGKQTFVAES
jgi:hypothetical protein